MCSSLKVLLYKLVVCARDMPLPLLIKDILTYPDR